MIRIPRRASMRLSFLVALSVASFSILSGATSSRAAPATATPSYSDSAFIEEIAPPGERVRLSDDERDEWAERGRATYDSFCVTCHGSHARGQGPLARLLIIRPTDLTRIARDRGGEFPTDAMHRRIDGSEVVLGHGTAEMPTWGRVLTVTGDPNDPEEVARVWREIREVVLYLESIQDQMPSE